MRVAMALAAALVLASAPLRAEVPMQQEVEESLTCQCGCGLTVHSCNHLQCPSGEPIKEEIRRRIGAGESKAVILEAFRVKYGEKVLSSPMMQGFNWLAWITPFAAVLFAGLLLVVALRRRVSATDAAIDEPPVAPRPGDSARRDRLARELDDMDRDA